MAIYGQYNAFKNYNSNYTARAKFWTMPRPSYHVNNEINIKVRNYGNNNYGMPALGGYGMPNNNFMNWLMGANLLGNLLKGLGDLFGNKKEPEKIDHGGAEGPEAPVNEHTPSPSEPEVSPAPSPSPSAEPTLNLFGEFQEVVTPTSTEEPQDLTTEVNNKAKIILTPEGKTGKWAEGYSWNSIGNAYREVIIAEDGTETLGEPIGNTSEFREWFRQNVLDGAIDIGTGIQHYPNNIEIGGKKFKFSKDDYKPTPYQISRDYNGTSAHTTKKTTTVNNTGSKTSYKGVKAKVTVTVNGKTTTYVSSGYDGDNLEELKNKAKADLRSKYPQLTSEQLENIKFVKQKSE